MIENKEEKNGKVYMYSVKINPNVTTRIHPDGKEIVFFKNSIPDANGRRCYCVVFTDMSLNDVMCLTPKQVFMLKLTHGDKIEITDWTDFYDMITDTFIAIRTRTKGKINHPNRLTV